MDCHNKFGSNISHLDPSSFPNYLDKEVAGVAQLVEQETLNLLVVGSSPSAGTNFHSHLHFVENMVMLVIDLLLRCSNFFTDYLTTFFA